jgi:hypothetical protein
LREFRDGVVALGVFSGEQLDATMRLGDEIHFGAGVGCASATTRC